MLKTPDAAHAHPPDALENHHTPPCAELASQHSVKVMDNIRHDGGAARSQWPPDNGERQFTDIALWLHVTLDCIHLDDRPQTVTFIHPDGTPGSYTFDFVAHLRDGRRLAIAVEEEALGSSDDRAMYFQSIKPLIPQSFADGTALFTERPIPFALLASARDEARCGQPFSAAPVTTFDGRVGA